MSFWDRWFPPRMRQPTDEELDILIAQRQADRVTNLIDHKPTRTQKENFKLGANITEWAMAVRRPGEGCGAPEAQTDYDIAEWLAACVTVALQLEQDAGGGTRIRNAMQNELNKRAAEKLIQNLRWTAAFTEGLLRDDCTNACVYDELVHKAFEESGTQGVEWP